MVQYQEYIDFAFFAVNFGYSKQEYYSLTRAEKLFLIKAYENKVVADSSVFASAVANAVGNVFRKKGKRAQKLWKRKPKRGDLRQRETDLAIAKQSQESDGNAWIEKIYHANGRKYKRKGQKPNGNENMV